MSENNGLKKIEGFWYPDSPETAISSYYAIYDKVPSELQNARDRIMNAGFIGQTTQFSLGKISYKYDEILTEFENFLLRLAASEQTKETAFINSYLRKVASLEKNSQNSSLVAKLEECLRAFPPDLSSAFNYINIYHFNLMNVESQIDYNIETWVKRVQPYMNKSIQELAESVIDNIAKNTDLTNDKLTPKKLVEMIKAGIREGLEGVITNELERSNFIKIFEQGFDEAVADMLKTKAAQNNFATTAAKIFYKEKVSADNLNAEGVKQALMNKYVRNALNGLGAEQFILMLGGEGGISTARQKRQLSFFSGKKQSVQTETDVYHIFDLTLEPNPNVEKEFKDEKGEYVNVDKKFLDFLEKTKEKNFIIHYSAKDSSKALSKSGNVPLNKKVGKIKETAGLDARINTILEMCNAEHSGSIDGNKLIFTMLNAGNKLIYQSGESTKAITTILTTLAIGFMFEDFEYLIEDSHDPNYYYLPVIGDPKTLFYSSGSQLHVYFLTGRFLTASDLLFRIYRQFHAKIFTGAKRNTPEYQIQQINNQKQKIINTTFSPSRNGVDLDSSKFKNLAGYDKWVAIRDEYMKDTKIGFNLLSTALFTPQELIVQTLEDVEL